MTNNKLFRPCVGLVLINHEGLIFLGQRLDSNLDAWQMPQGGIDVGENYYEAALRELKEETSIVSIELIQEIDKKLRSYMHHPEYEQSNIGPKEIDKMISKCCFSRAF